MSGSGARCVVPRCPGLRVEVLGPLRLVVDDVVVEVPGAKRRAVLALLALALSEGELDAALARSARGMPDPAAATALLRQARALWREPALADLVDTPPIVAWSVALDELLREVGDLLVSCVLDAGEGGDIVGLATEAVAEDPLREAAVLLLMRALAAAGRGAAALRAGHDHRRRLADETGLDPTPALGELERRIASGATGPAQASDHRRAAGLPQPATRLVGRDSEVAALRRLLAHERLVTVVGPGGVGKTRVALEVVRPAHDAHDAHDVTILALAPVTDPTAIPHALAAALDLNIRQGDVLAACVALLAAGSRLVMVDNCEHLLDAARNMISVLVDGCPALTVLATSREPLGLPAECTSRLAPLPLPGPRERLGWIPQWTTRRNLARLLHTLGDHEPALFLEVAADHAPEASAVSDVVWNQATPTMMYDLGDETASRIRSEASCCARDRVLEVARQSIDRHLTA